MAISFSCYILNENASPISGVKVYASTSDTTITSSNATATSNGKGLVNVGINVSVATYFHFVCNGYIKRVLKLAPGVNANFPSPKCIIMNAGSGTATLGYKATRLQVEKYYDWRGNTLSDSSCTAKYYWSKPDNQIELELGTYTKGSYVIELINGYSKVALSLDDGRSTFQLGISPDGDPVTSATFYLDTQKKYTNTNKLPPMKDLVDLLTLDSFK